MKKYPLYFPHSGSNLCQMPESKEFEISAYPPTHTHKSIQQIQTYHILISFIGKPDE